MSITFIVNDSLQNPDMCFTLETLMDDKRETEVAHARHTHTHAINSLLIQSRDLFNSVYTFQLRGWNGF